MGLTRTRIAPIVVALAACGSDAVTPDAMPDAAPRCDPSAPFTAPVPVGGLNTMLDDVTARLSPDELTVVFARRLSTNVYDLYTATRGAREEPFATPELLSTVNSINNDVWPTLSPDGLVLYFDSDRGTGVYHVYVSKRTATAERFGPAVPAAGLMDRETHPMLANGQALYFTSPTAVRTGVGLDDLWRVELDATGAPKTPTSVLGGVNSTDSEITAAVTEDELRIFFRRTTAGEADVYMAARSTAQDGFGAAAAVPVVAVVGISEVPTWISPDGCSLYFYSPAPNGAGGQDIYVTRRGGI